MSFRNNLIDFIFIVRNTFLIIKNNLTVEVIVRMLQDFSPFLVLDRMLMCLQLH